MNVKDELSENFLLQDFDTNDRISESIDRYKVYAAGYAHAENAIAVLSDLKERRSYMYFGGLAQILGIGSKGEYRRVDSIWEEDIFSRIAARDLERKHLEELQFIHFIRNLPKRNFSDYYLSSVLTMFADDGREYRVRHRVFYVAVLPNGSIRLALCLYNPVGNEADAGTYICESASGRILPLDQQDYSGLISKREKEILRLIGNGMLSKDISENLSISIHTVNRHRQNILSKLCAANSIEACRIARQLKLI